MDTVVVTRHAALVEFLIESGHVPADVKVIAHASLPAASRRFRLTSPNSCGGVNLTSRK